MAALVLDVILGLVICAVALGAVLARELLAAIVFFIVYGAMLSIAWVRLGSIDVALAEAAIGAGLTGILLIGAAGRLRDAQQQAGPQRISQAVALIIQCCRLRLARGHPRLCAPWPAPRDGGPGAAGRAQPRRCRA
jgi:uncharacterized MnhB-related membrane protein